MGRSTDVRGLYIQVESTESFPFTSRVKSTCFGPTVIHRVVKGRTG